MSELKSNTIPIKHVVNATGDHFKNNRKPLLSRCRTWLYGILVRFTAWQHRALYGMDIGEGTIISWRARLDKAINPKGIHIGSYSRITGEVIVLAHDHSRHLKIDTYIGSNTIIGIRSIILPGVKIGNHCVIGAGSVVTKDVPDGCIAAGNPAKIVRKGVKVNNNGQIIDKGVKV